MFKVRKKNITKIAGTVVSEDIKSWPAEIIKGLANQHPYIDTSKIKIEFTRSEDEGAYGKVSLKEGGVIPFSFRKNDVTRKMEMDPLDIIFDGSSFRSLNEKVIDELTSNQSVTDKKVPSNNKYIGHQTGDITPLEWSGYSNGMGTAKTASGGLLSYVLKNESDLDRVFSLLNQYSGVNSAAAAMGLRDTLESLRYGLVETTHQPRIAHILPRNGGGFAVAFDNGDTRAVEAKDLKAFLGEDFVPVVRRVMQDGWCIIRDFPTAKGIDTQELKVLPAPIRYGGKYILIEPTGERRCCYVFSEIMDYDGSVIKEQKAICPETLDYTKGKALCGIPVQQTDNIDLPISSVEIGDKGFFVDESWGSMKATPNIIIEKIIEMPGECPIIIARKEYGGGLIGLIIMNDLIRCQKMSTFNMMGNSFLPPDSYYVPAHMDFIKCNNHIVLADKEAIVQSRPEVTLQKNANRYYLFGQTSDGPVDLKHLTKEAMQMELALYGADDRVIKEASCMCDGEKKTLYGIKRVAKEAQKDGSTLPAGIFDELKTAAEEALQAVNEAEDQESVDPVLALQFISEETMRDLIGSDQIFEECEDRLARLILAARQGEKSINEKATARALKGLGEARKSLKTLALTLDDRE